MSNIILHSARLHCPVEHAFALFTRNELLQTWLARVADVEPVIDGKYELFWDPDDPTRNSTLGCKITAIEADTLLAFEWKGPPQFRFMNEINPLTHVAIFFTLCHEVLTPFTDLYLLHTGWGVGSAWDEARSHIANAWETVLAELEATVNG
jgi:uncharacterized protein YndB with AHSA1/START domain